MKLELARKDWTKRKESCRVLSHLRNKYNFEEILEMFKGHSFPKVIILQAVYFKLKFGLSYREVEEILLIRGVKVDHVTIQRWVFKFSPLIEKRFRKKKRVVGKRWRMDETYIKVKGEWLYLYRAVDQYGATIDFSLSKRRKRKNAQLFFIKAIAENGKPELINIDKSGSNYSGIKLINKGIKKSEKIKIWQSKYMNNVVEQDHRFIKKKIRRGLELKAVESAKRSLAGIEIMHIIHKKQLLNSKDSIFNSFVSLAA